MKDVSPQSAQSLLSRLFFLFCFYFFSIAFNVGHIVYNINNVKKKKKNTGAAAENNCHYQSSNPSHKRAIFQESTLAFIFFLNRVNVVLL